MNPWISDYNKLKFVLEKMGWKNIKNEATGLEEWYSQGILYANFSKKGKAFHIEYGDEGDVFGEEVE
jgi:hypothetical protein